eukprot:Skav200221  [mRNA]  locus=scaffold3745:356461:356808:- [translate_table: standard]
MCAAVSLKALMKMPDSDVERYNFLSDSALGQAQEVFNFLKGAGAEKYAQKFVECGFNTMEDVKNLTGDDLETCGVPRGHQKRILAHVQKRWGLTDLEPLPVPIASSQGGLGLSCG